MGVCVCGGRGTNDGWKMESLPDACLYVVCIRTESSLVIRLQK